MRSPVVAVTDHPFSDLAQERGLLEPLGFQFRVGQCKTEEDVIELCRDADAILTNLAPLTANTVARLERCRIIVRYGIGTDNVDLAAATERGLPVANVPDYGVQEVADHTMGLLLSAVRKIPAVSARVKAGIWEIRPLPPIMGLQDKTLGLAGFGNIARAVAQRAQSFNMRVIAFDPYISEAEFAKRNVRKATWERLLEESDILSIHLPLNAHTANMLNADALAVMKSTAYVLNTSRGGVIDTEALADALSRGQIGGAALDVLDREPLPPDHPLLSLDQCLITSHCAWYSEDSIRRLQHGAAAEVARLFSGEKPRNIVNLR
ncbi:C-terminal binding protein [Cohnella sp. GCM10020058]|uniref:C-terminal binding protein n=1 Tax=Cohnella sp. GCM10020058 TaxID=3317330 RepID=UPI003639ABDC